MRYKLENHKYVNSRLVLTIRKSYLFGLYERHFMVISSDEIYSRWPNMDVWYFYPSFEQIFPLTKLQDLCDASNRSINFIEENDKKV